MISDFWHSARVTRSRFKETVIIVPSVPSSSRRKVMFWEVVFIGKCRIAALPGISGFGWKAKWYKYFWKM
jgi:hypothetical protein